jgi:CubicO group peptidase (beta-lactamase class C family)
MDYARQKVLRPAGMERTRDDHVFAIIPNRARGYVVGSNGQVQNCSLADTSYKIPGGGLISTSDDLVRFGLAVRGGALCNRQSLEAMFAPQKTRDGKSTGYGLGWTVGSLDGRRLIRHTGGQQGVSTILAMLPREGVVVAIMTNLERAELLELAQRILRVAATVRFPQDQRTGQPSRTPPLTPASARPIL